MGVMAISGDGDRKDKVLRQVRTSLLAMQKKLSDFYYEENTRINGLVWEIDEVLPREKKA